MFKEFMSTIRLSYIVRFSMLILSALVLLFMFSCNQGKTVTTENYTQIDTTYQDTIVYNIIERDTTIISTNEIYQDTIIYRDSVSYKIRTKYKGLDLYMEPIEDSIGLAYAKAWVAKSRLNLLVVQRDSTIENKLDSALRNIAIKDSIITTIENRVSPSVKKWNNIRSVTMFVLIIVCVIVLYKLIVKFRVNVN